MDDTVNAEFLKAFIERIERLEEEKKGMMTDIKDIYSEAKGHGYDPKIIKLVVKLRSMDTNKRLEEKEILELYLQALGIPA